MVVVLGKQTAANRRNAQLSTGPRTAEGKSWSRRNAVKHRILASVLLIDGPDDQAEFDEMFSALSRDLAPVGKLEQLLVEKISVCFWRERLALRSERGLARQQEMGTRSPQEYLHAQVLAAITNSREIFRRRGILPPKGMQVDVREEVKEEVEVEENVEEIDCHRDSIKDSRSLPLVADLDRILRYETTIHRQLVYAINQLERLQRARKGEHVPAPVSVQLSSDQ